MKKMLKSFCVAVLAAVTILVAGCGGGVKAPKDTVAAIYIDLEKLTKNGMDIADMVVDEIPSNLKIDGEKVDLSNFKKEYTQSRKLGEAELKKLNPQWAMTTVTLDQKGREAVQLAVKLDAKNLESIEAILAAFERRPTQWDREDPEAKNERVLGEKAYHLQNSFTAVVLENKYVLASNKKESLEDLINLYKGKGDEAKSFRRAAELEGDAVARVIVADVGELLERFGLTKLIEQFGKEAHDKDLASLILGLEDITLDINYAKDNVGACLSVACDSSSDAKMFEQLFGSIAILARISGSIGAAQAEKTFSQLGHLLRKQLPLGRSDIERLAKMGTNFSGIISDISRSVEADRSGSTATLTLAVDLEDVVEEVIEAITK